MQNQAIINKFRLAVKHVNNIDDFERSIKSFKIEKEKGDLFELFAKLYFTLIPEYQSFRYYMYQEIPPLIKDRLHLPDKDKGVDGILMDDNVVYTVQVKFRSNVDTIIPFGDLATFMALSYGSDVKHIDSGIFFTNCLNVCDELVNDKYMIVNRGSFTKCNAHFWNNVRRFLKNQPVDIRIPKTPTVFQSQVLNLCKKYYETNDYGRLYMPCGTGKSLMGLWISSLLKCKKIFVAVPSLYLLSTSFEVWAENIRALNNVKFILIGSDLDRRKNKIEFEYKLTTNKDEIAEFTKKCTDKDCTYVFITTYQSADVMISACKETKFTFDIGIYDEAHRTTGDKKKEFSQLLNEISLSKYRLFMTATERIYRENVLTKETSVYSMNDKAVYGDVIYTYSTRMAITNGQLVDYDINALLIDNAEVLNAIKNNSYVEELQKTYDIKMILTCYMILKSFSTIGMNHMLVFCNKNAKAKEMNDIVKQLLLTETFENSDIDCWVLTGESSMTKRKQVVNSFENAKNGIIFSAKIFGEGVDIKICDSVCFTDNKQSTVDIVQYVGRCLRKYEKNPYKLSHVLIPCVIDGDSNILEENIEEFKKIKQILKAMSTTDDIVSEKFSIITSGNLVVPFNENGKDRDEIKIGIDIEGLKESILVSIFDKFGDPLTESRKALIFENEKRYVNNEDLLISIDECNKFLKDSGKQLLIDRHKRGNFVKFCVGSRIFEELKKKYYYSTDMFEKVVRKLKIDSVHKYKHRYHLDSQLPPMHYIDNGFYEDIDLNFNVVSLFDDNIKVYEC